MAARILLVDDNQDSCAVVAKALSARGYEVDVAFDGPDALECVARNQYNMAVIDYRMPGMNGVELFRRIREVQPEMVGVFLTGFTTIDTVYPAIEAGVERVLAKPVDFQELIPLVEEYVGKPV